MSKIATILSINLGRLINTAFAYFMEMSLQLIDGIGSANIGLPDHVYSQFRSSVGRLNHLVNSTHASGITQVLNDLDEERDNGFKAFYGMVKSACTHLVESKRIAANSVYLIIKPYKDTATLAHDDESQSISSMRDQLRDPMVFGHVMHLGIDDLLEELYRINLLYIENQKERLSQEESTACLLVRLECGDQFERICLIAQSYIITNPSQEGNKFIEDVNKLIKKTNTSYKQKKSHHKTDEPVVEEDLVTSEAVTTEE